MFTSLIQHIEQQRYLHRVLLRVWRQFPPRLAGFLKGLLARSWVLGAVAVAAYSYMSLVPIIQPPIAKLLTTRAERQPRKIPITAST